MLLFDYFLVLSRQMKEKNPISLKLEAGLHERLEKAATEVGVKKHTLAIMAIEAVVDAIEQNDYQLVLPVKFVPVNVPFEQVPPFNPKSDGVKMKRSKRYPGHSPKNIHLNESPEGEDKSQ